MDVSTYPPRNETGPAPLGYEFAGALRQMTSIPFRFGAAPRLVGPAGGVAACLLSVMACLGLVQPLEAQSKRPSAVLFNTAGAPAGSPLDSVIQGSLEELAVVDITSRPGMDLGAVQLAVDCVAETTHCLNAVATQNGVEMLIAPTLQRTPGELVLSILRFDARGAGKMRRVVRRQSGHVLGSDLLDAVPNMLRELFELPPKKETTATAAPGEAAAAQEAPAPDHPTTTLPYDQEEPPSWKVPAGPIVLASVGVLAIGGGAIAGALMKNKEQQYERLAVDTPADAQTAIDTRSTGKTQAIVANVLFGVGAAAVIGGGIWLLVDHANYAARVESANMTSTSLQPLISPQQLGLVVTHRGGSL